MIINSHNTSNKVFIIAEIGNNHEGDFNTALDMISAAADTGANAVKFQTIVPELFINKENRTRFNKLKSFQLSYKQFEKLSIFATKKNILFCSTPFDIASAKFLNNIQSFFKISSGDNEFFPLIESVCKFNKPIILSTGLVNLNQIKKIVKFIKNRIDYKSKLALLHCVSAYPTPIKDANLKSINFLREHFRDLTLGYSDHTLGIEAAALSVACGAKIIEKHFTINKNLSDFRDHKLSADPKQMTNMVKKIRKIENILGDNNKEIQFSERNGLIDYTRSIASNKYLKKGAKVKKKDLTWIRPGKGFKPGDENLVLNKILKHNILNGHIFKKSDFKE